MRPGPVWHADSTNAGRSACRAGATGFAANGRDIVPRRRRLAGGLRLLGRSAQSHHADPVRAGAHSRSESAVAGVFGELSVLDNGPRSATAIAMQPTAIAQLSGEEFLDELSRSPNLAFDVLREPAAHLRISNLRAMSRASDNLAERLAHLLLELSHKFRRHGGASAQIELPVNQDELAAWVGCTREAVARSMGVLRTAGVIETGRNKVIIRQPDALFRFVNGPAGRR